MTREELQSRISEIAPMATAIEGGEWLNMDVAPADWKNVAKLVRHTAGLDMDYLFCLTCVDWKTHLTMVYHLTSTTHRQTVVFKVKLDREKAEVLRAPSTTSRCCRQGRSGNGCQGRRWS